MGADTCREYSILTFWHGDWRWTNDAKTARKGEVSSHLRRSAWIMYTCARLCVLLTLQPAQHTPWAHSASSFKVQLLALQQSLVHSCRRAQTTTMSTQLSTHSNSTSARSVFVFFKCPFTWHNSQVIITIIESLIKCNKHSTCCVGLIPGHLNEHALHSKPCQMILNNSVYALQWCGASWQLSRFTKAFHVNWFARAEGGSSRVRFSK